MMMRMSLSIYSIERLLLVMQPIVIPSERKVRLLISKTIKGGIGIWKNLLPFELWIEACVFNNNYYQTKWSLDRHAGVFSYHRLLKHGGVLIWFSYQCQY